MRSVMRIGAVNYLNSKPLVYGLESLAPKVRVTYDLPSRLADSLVAGRLDVALVPSVEFFRTPGSTIVSDACVACRGPVLSVKLHFRVPPRDVRRVALDEGSRTSAALTRILLAELYGVQPTWEPLPIGCGIETTNADAVLLIGDRAIADSGFRKADQRAGSSARLSLPNASTPSWPPRSISIAAGVAVIRKLSSAPARLSRRFARSPARWLNMVNRCSPRVSTSDRRPACRRHFLRGDTTKSRERFGWAANPPLILPDKGRETRSGLWR
jgi:Menaquinone biosynthesis